MPRLRGHANEAHFDCEQTTKRFLHTATAPPWAGRHRRGSSAPVLVRWRRMSVRSRTCSYSISGTGSAAAPLSDRNRITVLSQQALGLNVVDDAADGPVHLLHHGGIHLHPAVCHSRYGSSSQAGILGSRGLSWPREYTLCRSGLAVTAPSSGLGVASTSSSSRYAWPVASRCLSRPRITGVAAMPCTTTLSTMVNIAVDQSHRCSGKLACPKA